MSPARDRLRTALGSVTFREPDPIVVANVDARAHSEPGDWPGLLSAQLCSPVRWHQTLFALAELGALTFAELGPGGVLTGLAKRTLTGEGFTTVAVSSPTELEAFVAMLTASDLLGAAEVRADPLFQMTERLVVASATGPFRPVEQFASAAPTLGGGPPVGERIVLHVGVGDLIGWAGESEIRSPFSGTLEGIIVLAGERVVGGQPVAWLRADQEE
jgi:[acyl-carrier-protein] S-malonyltransferase